MVRRVSLTASLLALCVALGCGGARRGQGADAESCRKELDAILDSDDVCDPVLAEHLEGRAKEWQRTCSRHADYNEKAAVDQKITGARRCSELRLEQAALERACKEKIEEIDARPPCLGDVCALSLENLKGVRADCDGVKLDASTRELDVALEQKLQAGIDNGRMLTELRVLSDDCGRISALTAEGQGAEVLSRIIEFLDKRQELFGPPSENAELEQVRKEMLKRCGETAISAAETVAQSSASDLSSNRTMSKRRLWISRYRKLERLHRSLTDLRAESYLVGSTAPLSDVLSRFEKTKARFEAQERARLDKTAVSALNKGARRCRAIRKRLTAYRSKIEEYTKKENDKKVSAYRRKAEQTENRLEELKEGIAHGVEAKVLPEDELKEALDSLAQAGCPVETAVSLSD